MFFLCLLMLLLHCGRIDACNMLHTPCNGQLLPHSVKFDLQLFCVAFPLFAQLSRALPVTRPVSICFARCSVSH